MLGTTGELDRSNTLMTPQELERMPDQGLEFEQSVGPKELPKLLPAQSANSLPELANTDLAANSHLLNYVNDSKYPIVLGSDGKDLTSITVLTTQGEKVRGVYQSSCGWLLCTRLN